VPGSTAGWLATDRANLRQRQPDRAVFAAVLPLRLCVRPQLQSKLQCLRQFFAPEPALEPSEGRETAVAIAVLFFALSRETHPYSTRAICG
jgi:hypothetical protein